MCGWWVGGGGSSSWREAGFRGDENENQQREWTVLDWSLAYNKREGTRFRGDGKRTVAVVVAGVVFSI